MTSTLRRLPGILAVTTLAFIVATAPAMADIPAHLSDLVTGDVRWADQEDAFAFRVGEDGRTRLTLTRDGKRVVEVK